MVGFFSVLIAVIVLIVVIAFFIKVLKGDVKVKK